MRNLFAFVVLLAWLSLGAWFYTCKIKNLCEEVPLINLPNNKKAIEVINPADLKKAYSSVFEAEKDLAITKSIPVIGINDEFKNSADGIAFFLKNHPKTKLSITGRYQEDEANTTDFGDIGLARAELIKLQMKERGVPDEQLVLSSKIDNEMFDPSGKAKDNSVIDFTFSEEYEQLNDSDIKTAYKSTFLIQDYVYFQKDSLNVNLKDNFDQALQGISYYLNGNNDQDLRIELEFENGEKSGLNDMDIGLVRAYNLKQKLVAKGIPKSRIIINSKQGYGIYAPDNISTPEAVNFNFIFPDVSNEDKLAEMQIESNLEKELTSALRSPKEDAIKDSILTAQNGNPNLDEIVIEKNAYIQFNFGSSEVTQNNNFENTIKDLKTYLAANPDKEIEIIGHTCNVGDNNFNMMLGTKRAEAAKAVLENHGINSAKIKIKSKGAYTPAFSNDTKDGRAKNRRVEIDIK